MVVEVVAVAVVAVVVALVLDMFTRSDEIRIFFFGFPPIVFHVLLTSNSISFTKLIRSF